jgi:Ca-activated chloride channel family protein
MWTELHFLRPWWLLALLPLIIFLALFARRRFEMRRWEKVVDATLLPHVLIGTDQQTRRRSALLLALAGTLLITALAGPVWQRVPQPVFRNLDALVIVLDLSASMNVEDVSPSRLARARFKIRDILDQREDGQTALVAYAAAAFVISPLTDDAQTIAALVPALTTNLMPSQGSRADRGLEKARELLHQSGATSGHVLLISDGVDESRAARTAAELAADGISVSVLGVGTEAGGPVPGRNGFMTRNDGSIVIAQLDVSGLREVARQGDGQYRQLTASDNDIASLLGAMTDRPGETEDTGLQTDSWHEEGPWLLLPLLLLAPFAFRRGVLAAWLLVLMLPLPMQQANAFTTDDLWSRPDQRASRLLAEGDAGAATELFNDPEWKAAAAYQAGLYAESLAALDGLTASEPTYNRGNALAQLGRYAEAIAAYEEVLEQEPNHRDARYNLEAVKELLENQQQEQQQAQDQNQSQDQNQQQDKGDQSANNDGSANDQESDDADSGEGDDTGDSANDDSESGSSDTNNAAQNSDQQNQGQDGDGSQNSESMPQDTSQNNGQNSGQNNSGTDTQQQDQAGDPDTASNAATADELAADNKSAEENSATAGAESGAMDAEEQADSDAPKGRAMTPDGNPTDEEAQAAEQWLRKIPDDPGGLLRRKFLYQYQQQPAADEEEQPW